MRASKAVDEVACGIEIEAENTAYKPPGAYKQLDRMIYTRIKIEPTSFVYLVSCEPYDGIETTGFRVL